MEVSVWGAPKVKRPWKVDVVGWPLRSYATEARALAAARKMAQRSRSMGRIWGPDGFMRFVYKDGRTQP